MCSQSKDICAQLQDGLLKVAMEMQTVSKNSTRKMVSFLRSYVMVQCLCAQAWRTYHQYHSDYVCADGKLKEAEKQEEKQKQSAAKKLERLIEKVNEDALVLFCGLLCVELFYLFLLTDILFAQRQGKVKETYLKSSKARNEYLINLGASNATMKNFYLQDISALIDVRRVYLICVVPFGFNFEMT